MKDTLTKSSFVSGFHQAGRGDAFSYKALCALFEYLEECEQDTGVELEFDPIALCGEWTEYESLLDAAQAYGWEPDPMDPDDDGDSLAVEVYNDDCNKAALEWLNDRTAVILLSGGLESGTDNHCIIQDF